MSIAFPFSAPDLVCVSDLDPLASETVNEEQNLEQDCFHALLQRPKSNPDAPDRGVGVETYLSGTSNDLLGLPAAIVADLEKDPRVASVSAPVTLQPDGSYRIDVEIETKSGLVFPLSYAYTSAGGLVRR